MKLSVFLHQRRHHLHHHCDLVRLWAMPSTSVMGTLLYKVTELPYFRLQVKVSRYSYSVNHFICSGSVTVTSYHYLNVTKSLLVTTKVISYVAKALLRYIKKFLQICIRAADFEGFANKTETKVDVSIEMFSMSSKSDECKELLESTA